MAGKAAAGCTRGGGRDAHPASANANGSEQRRALCRGLVRGVDDMRMRIGTNVHRSYSCPATAIDVQGTRVLDLRMGIAGPALAILDHASWPGLADGHGAA
jgi:hypothetical protein